MKDPVQFDELITRLKALGLSSYEAKAYVILLKLKIATSTEIAKEAHIPQPRVYDVLKSLEDKGLVIISEGRPRLYRVEDPRVAFTRLLNRTIERLRREYEGISGVLERLYREHENLGGEEIWMLNTETKIYDKLLEIIDHAEHELLISAYIRMMPRIQSRLKKLSKKGVSICLVTYDEMEPQTYVDEHRLRITQGVVIAIPDRKEMVFVTNWSELGENPTGFYTGNKHMLKLFTEYFLHDLRGLSKPVYISWGEKVFIRRFVNMVRAIDMINTLKNIGRKITVKVRGRYTKTKRETVVEGIPIRTEYDIYKGIARIIIRSGRKTISIGGWYAYLEDVEADIIEVIS
ncbi:MAG: hypothetical protein J7K21_02715 [Desulfurococcales archaeon]|nr:hypothetical protein [Desulfurococcales archaeon]